ncbi:MAG TPA: SAM-dependent methyltransferase, partial [Pilimelia sp.]|nr:SAM-dependent methyltransferase [Pilimelia sp.]
MTATTTAATERRDALVDQIFHATTAALEVAHVYLGDRLGLYRQLAGVDSATADELAVRAGVDP